MLVLTRKKNEKVRIFIPASAEPTEIEVNLCELRGDRARIGFEIPAHVIALRGELGPIDQLKKRPDADSARRDDSAMVSEQANGRKLAS